MSNIDSLRRQACGLAGGGRWPEAEAVRAAGAVLPQKGAVRAFTGAGQGPGRGAGSRRPGGAFKAEIGLARGLQGGRIHLFIYLVTK